MPGQRARKKSVRYKLTPQRTEIEGKTMGRITVRNTQINILTIV